MKQIGDPALILMVAPIFGGGVATAVAPVSARLGAVSAWPLGQALRQIAAAPAGSVVHVHPSLRARSLVRAGLVVAASRGKAVVASFHGWDAALAVRLPRGWLAGLGAATALTEAHRDALVAWGLPAERVGLVPNAIDPAALPVAREPGPPVALYLGRLVDGKGLLELVRAFVLTRTPALELVLAGEGPLRDALLRAAAESGRAARIRLVGWIDGESKRRWLARASVLVLPSREESFPVSVAEALACGVPVVASPVGAIPGMVGSAGLLVEPGDERALADAIDQVLAAPPDVSGAQDRIRAICDPGAVAAAWSAMYDVAGQR